MRLLLAALALLAGLPGGEALSKGISPQAAAQIRSIAADKEARTPAQRKLDSNLVYLSRAARGLPAVAGAPDLRAGIEADAQGGTIVEVSARVDDSLLEAIRALGGKVLDSRPAYDSVRAWLPLGALEGLAARSEVGFISPKREAITSRVRARGRPAILPGSTEGVVTHRADLARTTFGATGLGVKVGVLSDGVDSLATLQAAGRLPAVTVLPGQQGSWDEGTAMLEIVHEMAPDAELYFARGLSSIESFAQNIRDLRGAGCDAIVDDAIYYSESPFQKGQAPGILSPSNGGVVSQAVNDVTAAGALYFSCAGNSGNLDSGGTGVWEGDFRLSLIHI